MYEIFTIIALFIVGIIAGVINVMAGGGSSLTLPALIFLGLDPTVANGTNRIAILSQNVFATLSFKKSKMLELGTSIKYAMFTIPGVILGAFTAVKISDELFQKILGIILILVIFTFFINPVSFKKYSEKKNIEWIIYPALILVGFYGGFIQVGVGFLIMAVLYHLLNLNLLKVNVHKVLIVLIYTFPVILIFFISGNINWFLGICLAAGNSVGGWLGAGLSVKGGEKYIRYALVVAVLIMAIKLLGGFNFIRI
ncbi:MAG: TSUP family transporter [Candidatus Dadabacteria bacterium]|nr:TSUP family transporter [Candidatus Dadabacteria bacterium]